MKFQEVLKEYYDASDDKYSKVNIDDTRRPRLTLEHLNKLRKMREINAVEQAERQKFFKTIYAKPSENA
tara:strand:+ start:154 stop:360 length:207 start_codon:yes stop_codon:yes gene_type:complete